MTVKFFTRFHSFFLLTILFEKKKKKKNEKRSAYLFLSSFCSGTINKLPKYLTQADHCGHSEQIHPHTRTHRSLSSNWFRLFASYCPSDTGSEWRRPKSTVPTTEIRCKNMRHKHNIIDQEINITKNLHSDVFSWFCILYFCAQSRYMRIVRTWNIMHFELNAFGATNQLNCAITFFSTLICV